jgi:hypothetical protein
MSDASRWFLVTDLAEQRLAEWVAPAVKIEPAVLFIHRLTSNRKFNFATVCFVNANAEKIK